jgi:hypothetical protein
MLSDALLPDALADDEMLNLVLAVYSAPPSEQVQELERMAVLIGERVEAGLVSSSLARSYALGTAIAAGVDEQIGRVVVGRHVPGPAQYEPGAPILVRRTTGDVDDRIALFEERAIQNRVLPAEGKWEYKVLSLSEMFGLATAKGTAGRLQELLNTHASDGWELVTISDRDSRWMAGESLIVTFRRFVVTVRSYQAFVAEREAIRRDALCL